MITVDYKQDIDHIKKLVKMLDYRDEYFIELINKNLPSGRDFKLFFNAFDHSWSNLKTVGESCCRIVIDKQLNITDQVLVIRKEINNFLENYYDLTSNSSLTGTYIYYNKGLLSVKDVYILLRPFVILENHSIENKKIIDYMIDDKIDLRSFVKSVRNIKVGKGSLKRIRRIAMNLKKYEKFFIITDPGIIIEEDKIDHTINILSFQQSAFEVNCQLYYNYKNNIDTELNLKEYQKDYILERNDV